MNTREYGDWPGEVTSSLAADDFSVSDRMKVVSAEGVVKRCGEREVLKGGVKLETP
jgi:hypothetical protein